MIELSQKSASPAEKASILALDAVFEAIRKSKNFKLEAGAGAGKTYSLIKVLQFLIKREGKILSRNHQKIACITFTKVAKEEIEAQIDRNPVIECNTIHAFCWSIISNFQSQLRDYLPTLEGWSGDPWEQRIQEAGGVANRKIEYKLGHRQITKEAISLHHNDVLPLTILMFEHEKFRNIFRFQYPFILIDEYQDTNADWIAAMRKHFFEKDGPPLFGFFGDHWQKIYGDGCGGLIDPSIVEVGKEANFRSVTAIVNCLKLLRPELKQSVVDPRAPGEVYIFHTNRWAGKRKKGQHYSGDLQDQDANTALGKVKDRLIEAGWDLSSEKTKILMLTHRALSNQQGYSSLPSVFRDNNSFSKKEQPHIAFLVDSLEPACRAFVEKRYGEMFEKMGANKTYLNSAAKKILLSESMSKLIEIRETGTVSDVISHLRKTHIPQLSEAVEKLELQLESFDTSTDDEMPRSIKELQNLHSVPYKEIISVANYLEGHSPFETKHGVKGAQFENVLVIVGRGWNKYNFGKMLEAFPDKDTLKGKEREFFEDNRNLFYVACSRPKKRLALLFTQELSNKAMETVENIFGTENIESVY